MWTAPLNVVRFGATTLWHFDAEERAPSTTSKAHMMLSNRDVRFTPDSDRGLGRSTGASVLYDRLVA
jgi:hypothetical protein